MTAGNFDRARASDDQATRGLHNNRGWFGMTRTFLFLAVLGVATGGIARAEGFDVIETRQAGQDLLSGDFAGIRGVVAAKGDIKATEASAKAMARWARQIPTLFPKGSETGHNTKATAAVWSDPAGFQKIAIELADASDKMAEFAKAGDADGVSAQIKLAGAACGACHKTYRER
jgi:cytochrome c556